MIVRNSPNSHDFQGLTWYSDYKMNYWTPQHKAKINVRTLQFPLWISAHSCVRYGIQQIWAIKGRRWDNFYLQGEKTHHHYFYLLLHTSIIKVFSWLCLCCQHVLGFFHDNASCTQPEATSQYSQWKVHL